MSKVMQTPDEVVEFCKLNGIILHAERVSGNLQLSSDFVQKHMAHALARHVPACYTSDQKMYLYDRLLVSKDAYHALNAQLGTEPVRPIRKSSSFPFPKTFVYLDISDFSQESTDRQNLIITQFVNLMRAGIDAIRLADKPELICIGDGYVFVFDDTVSAVLFAAVLADQIERLNANPLLLWIPIHFRIGIHRGSVNAFWDIGRDCWNYVGVGINGGRRVLEAMGRNIDDVIYLSSNAREDVQREPGSDRRILNYLENKGRHADKHGNGWRLYQLNHCAVMDHAPDLRNLDISFLR